VRTPATLALTLFLAACATGGAPDPTSPRGAGEAYDVVLLNGRIVDGTGAAWFHGDLAIRGDRIARITGGPRGFDNWLTDMETNGASVNVGSFLGGSNVRTYAKGASQGPASPAELDSMRQVVRWAMEGGAFGIATALIYPPATFASTTELIEASRAMAPYGGVYITHKRSEADQYLEALGRSHPDRRRGRRRRGDLSPETRGCAQLAQGAGRHSHDRFRPGRGGRRAGQHLSVRGWRHRPDRVLPPVGLRGQPALRQPGRPRRPGSDARRDEHATTWSGRTSAPWPPPRAFSSWASTARRTWLHRNAPVRDRRRPQQDWIETAFDLVLSERQRVGTIYFLMDEDNVRLKMQQPWMKFGTDAGGVTPRPPAASCIPAPTAPSRGSSAGMYATRAS
jgi:N-acyl-D-amino-acid deacylase